ncbi:hypothetical protein QF050_001297 [Arthrobacter sp. SLBN-112]|nr:hypothetical protein [Arthrobacter sp. SLBN-112]
MPAIVHSRIRRRAERGLKDFKEFIGYAIPGRRLEAGPGCCPRPGSAVPR